MANEKPKPIETPQACEYRKRWFWARSQAYVYREKWIEEMKKANPEFAKEDHCGE